MSPCLNCRPRLTDHESLGRLRITLSASHSSDDIKRLVNALNPWLSDKHGKQSFVEGHAEQSYVVASKL